VVFEGFWGKMWLIRSTSSGQVFGPRQKGKEALIEDKFILSVFCRKYGGFGGFLLPFKRFNLL
jgi:hypothetical protein